MAELETYVLAASIIIVALGWFVQHRLERHKDRVNRRDEIRIRFLTESYGLLNYSLHTGIESKADALKFQEILNTIFLLGRRELERHPIRWNHHLVGIGRSNSLIYRASVLD